ncbi:MAG: cobalamin biosynthesis protein CbiX, partial [Micromonosporaceae bacterium]
DRVVRALRGGAARRVAVASYFLAPGLLYDRAVAGAQDAGAVAVADPLVAVPELVSVVLDRYRVARSVPVGAAA